VNSAIEFTIADFPGYAEFVARENELRAGACLGINETICGCDVKPLNAAHIALLSLVRSPFLSLSATEIWDAVMDSEERRAQLQCDILRFLWIVSPQYEQGSRAGVIPRRKWYESRHRHLRRAAAAMTARDKFNAAFAPVLKQPVDKVLQEICQYVDDAYIDTDDSRPDGAEKTGWAFQISIACELSTNHGYRVDFWNPACPVEKNPLLVPLKIVTQLRKYRQARRGEPIKNRSDSCVVAFLETLKPGGGGRN
jgi:hypothetical protein